MEIAKASLEDKYTIESGRVFLTGTQALIRLMMLQRLRDQQAGLNTAGFVSGYRGLLLMELNTPLDVELQYVVHSDPGDRGAIAEG